MANYICIKYDVITEVISKIKPAYFCKTEIHNENKNMLARTIRFTFGNEREYINLPSYQQSGMFIISR